MSRNPPASLPNRLVRVLAAAGLAVPLHAGAALLVYEPFDYSAPSILNGTSATGRNLAGTYVSDVVNENYQLRVSAPGLDYGNLAGAPRVAGAKLTQLSGTTSNGSVGFAQPVSIPAGSGNFLQRAVHLQRREQRQSFREHRPDRRRQRRLDHVRRIGRRRARHPRQRGDVRYWRTGNDGRRRPSLQQRPDAAADRPLQQQRGCLGRSARPLPTWRPSRSRTRGC